MVFTNCAGTRDMPATDAIMHSGEASSTRGVYTG